MGIWGFVCTHGITLQHVHGLVLTQWSYVFLALTHWCVVEGHLTMRLNLKYLGCCMAEWTLVMPYDAQYNMTLHTVWQWQDETLDKLGPHSQQNWAWCQISGMFPAVFKCKLYTLLLCSHGQGHTVGRWFWSLKPKYSAQKDQHSRFWCSRSGPGFTKSSTASWWRHQMETFSTLLAICAGNSPGTGEFPAQRLVTWSFDVFFDLHLNKWLSKQS